MNGYETSQDDLKNIKYIKTFKLLPQTSNYKRTNKRRPWVTREVQKKRRAKNKAWKKFHKLKEEIRDGLSCENEARLENLNRNYVNKRNICNDANRAATKNFEQKLSRNVKEDTKSFYNYVRGKQKRK